MDKAYIIDLRENLDFIINKYKNIIGSEAINIEKEYSIESSSLIKKALKIIEDENRVLKIGILGRVKAGKSSLLNALLFEGKAILPKAATPMTAALTQISYGESLGAEVEFFTKDDIEKIKLDHSRYERELEEIEKKEKEKYRKNKVELSKETEEKIKKRANRSMKEKIGLCAAYDQYNKMKESGVDSTSLEENKILNSDSLSNLKEALLEYVGSNGKYMPFTKSVSIKLPQEKLIDIQIIDTPGLNDPVQSREDRTRQLLKYCDVIFIVSPSGQFLSREDTDLMDRITSKERIHELFVISSQVDTQLMGSEKKRFNGELPRVLNGITSNLGEHLSSTLSQLKNNNPEIGNVFDQLIEQGKEKVIHSSGICQTIKMEFDNKKNLDDGAKKVWENLTREYPDYFSDTDKILSLSNLELLGNISQINDIVTSVRKKKDNIIIKRKEEFIQARLNSLLNYKKDLISSVNEKLFRIKNGDVEELKKQKATLQNIQQKATDILNEEYYELVDELKISLKEKLTKVLNEHFKETKNSVDSAEGCESESYKVEKTGVGSWFARKIWGGGYETQTRTYATVRTGAVRETLENLTIEIEKSIDEVSQNFLYYWKKGLYKNILEVLRDNVGDDELEPQLIRKTIRNVVNSIEYPDIKYSGNLPNSLSVKGTLRDSRAEEFLDDSRNYISNLRKRVKEDIESYLSALIPTLREFEPSVKIFKNYREQIEELEIQMKNRAITIDSFDRLIKELEGVR